MARHTASFWIERLQLSRHAEGGWFSEVYRSGLMLQKEQLPSSFTGKRNACTHIYFLLEGHGFSAFHRIKSDELWHFHDGDPFIIYEFDQNDKLVEHLLGNDPEKGQSLFCVIKGSNWFASKLADSGEYGLAGCTVAPGFDFNDFELAEKDKLLMHYPHYDELISRMTLK